MNRFTGYLFFIFLCGLALILGTPVKVSAGNGAVAALFKKGIRLETNDWNYSLTFNPRIQIRYANSIREGSGNDAHSLMIRRMYLNVFGHAITPDLTYYTTISLTPGGTAQNVMHYAWLNYLVTDAFQLKSGLIKLPFNRQEMTSSGEQQFIDRSLANERYNLDRSIAFVFHGKPFGKRLEYYLTVANGRATRAVLNTNQEMAYIARLVLNLYGYYGYSEGDVVAHDDPALTVGVAGELHHEETTVSALEDRVITGAADIGFKYRGFSFQAEGFFRNTKPAGVSAVTDIGYYAQAGYFLIPKKFEVAVRASGLFDDINNDGGGVYFNNGSLTSLGGSNDGVDEGPDSADEHAFSVVLNSYFYEHNLKWQLQYTYMRDGVAGAADVNNHLLMTQVQMQF